MQEIHAWDKESRNSERERSSSRREQTPAYTCSRGPPAPGKLAWVGVDGHSVTPVTPEANSGAMSKARTACLSLLVP